MGKLAKPQRSNKNKKIKAIDPFYKGNRKDRRSALQNQKPSSYEQEIPKKLLMLGFSIDKNKMANVSGKKSKNKFKVQKDPDAPEKYNNFNTPLGAQSSQPKPKPAPKKDTPVKRQDEKREKNAEKEEGDEEATPRKSKKERRKERYEEIQRLKQNSGKPEIPKEVVNNYIDTLKPIGPYLKPKFKQRQNESGREFFRRVEDEAQMAISKSKMDAKWELSDEKKMIQSMKKAKKESGDRKKQRLKERKEKKAEAVREKKREKTRGFHELKDKVSFGEVNEAPPSLTVKPKNVKIVRDQDRPGLRMPELKDAIARNVAESQGANPPTPNQTTTSLSSRPVGKSLKRKNLSTKEKQMSDAKRDSVIEAYRQMKKRKT